MSGTWTGRAASARARTAAGQTRACVRVRGSGMGVLQKAQRGTALSGSCTGQYRDGGTERIEHVRRFRGMEAMHRGAKPVGSCPSRLPAEGDDDVMQTGHKLV